MARVSEEMQKRIDELASVIEKQYIEAGVLRQKAIEEATGIVMRAGSGNEEKVGKKRGPKAGKKRGPKPGRKAAGDGEAAVARKKFAASIKAGGEQAAG